MNMLNTKSSIYSPGWLQVVFSQNNQRYGAYKIRLMHRHYLGNAILYSFAGAILLSMLLLSPQWLRSRPQIYPDLTKDPIDLTPMPFTPQLPKQEVTPPAREILPSSKSGGALKIVKGPDLITSPAVTTDPDPVFTDPAGTPGTDPGPGTTTTPGSDITSPAFTGAFRVVEVNPQFKGGDTELIRYLRKNIRYPNEAKRKGIVGVVNIEFTIAEDGTVTDLYINSGIGGGCDEEAMRVVANMPKWTPGRQAGLAVPVRLNLPIRFSLK